MDQPRVTLSVVSHGQGELIEKLFADLRRLPLDGVTVILTLNVPDEDDEWIEKWSDLPIRVIRNEKPRGFGANHNRAFAAAADNFFCVVNPDIRLPDAAFVDLTQQFADRKVGVCAPLVVGSDGVPQDSVRRFPTVGRLLRRVVLKQRMADYRPDGTQSVDWAAGMFLMFRRESFAALSGFDEGYYMYFEDADICRRMRRADWTVVYDPSVVVVHDAQRDSHRAFRHLWWHLTSARRFLADRRRHRHLQGVADGV